MQNLLTKSYRQMFAELEFVLFYTTNLQKFLAHKELFLGALFPNISTELKSAKMLHLQKQQ
jgi:hypothetical protein